MIKIEGGNENKENANNRRIPKPKKSMKINNIRKEKNELIKIYEGEFYKRKR